VTISFHDHLHAFPPGEEEDFGEGQARRRIHKVRFTISPWAGRGERLESELAQDFIRAMDFHMAQMQDVGEFLSHSAFSEQIGSNAPVRGPLEMFGAEEVSD